VNVTPGTCGCRVRPRFRSRADVTCGLCVLLVGLDGCEVRLCGPCAFVRPRVPCVPCASRLPPMSFYRYMHRVISHTNLTNSRHTHSMLPRQGGSVLPALDYYGPVVVPSMLRTLVETLGSNVCAVLIQVVTATIANGLYFISAIFFSGMDEEGKSAPRFP
jgi:hypothetical protein